VWGLALAVICPASTAQGEEAVFAMDVPRQRLAAPGFRLTDLTGAAHGLEDFRGSVVLVHFWATFCAPCLQELPRLEALWQHYREAGLVVAGIAADRGNAGVVREYAARAGITFPVLLDPDGAVRNRYEVVVLPMSYLIGRDGRFSARMLGSREWQDPQLSDLIESLLAERRP
jgi:peroxiredoxin